MIDKMGRWAEALASNGSASRRGFLGRLGKVALGVAGLVGGLLALPQDTGAGGSVLCCRYVCGQPEGRSYVWTCQTASFCPERHSGPGFTCILVGGMRAAACANCPRR